MPYKSITQLPKPVKQNLPTHAKEIYKEAFNSAYKQYDHRQGHEEIAHRVAWSAVKKKYHKNKVGSWVEI